MCVSERIIYTLNAKNNMMLSLIKSDFSLSDEKVHEIIISEYQKMILCLEQKAVKYESLKRALIPNQDKKKTEVCLMFDSTVIDSYNYEYTVFDKVLPFLGKESTYSILAGDYIVPYTSKNKNPAELYDLLRDAGFEGDRCSFNENHQYYFVYLNSITESQILTIDKNLEEISWYVGYVNLKNSSKLKRYLSYILVPVCIKSKSKMIVRYTDVCSDKDTVNMHGCPFEKYGFNIVSIHEISFDLFLSYKIESNPPDEADNSFSFNALFPNFISGKQLKLNLSNSKWQYLCNDSGGKGGITKSFLAYEGGKNDFQRIIYEKICKNYIYNLKSNKYNDLLFNVCIEMATKKGNMRKTTVSLKYKPTSGEMYVVTIT